MKLGLQLRSGPIRWPSGHRFSGAVMMARSCVVLSSPGLGVTVADGTVASVGGLAGGLVAGAYAAAGPRVGPAAAAPLGGFRCCCFCVGVTYVVGTGPVAVERVVVAVGLWCGLPNGPSGDFHGNRTSVLVHRPAADGADHAANATAATNATAVTDVIADTGAIAATDDRPRPRVLIVAVAVAVFTPSEYSLELRSARARRTGPGDTVQTGGAPSSASSRLLLLSRRAGRLLLSTASPAAASSLRPRGPAGASAYATFSVATPTVRRPGRGCA